MTETCNHCDAELKLTEEMDVVAVICPECENLTGVCANSKWHGIDEHVDCNRCPFNIKLLEDKK